MSTITCAKILIRYRVSHTPRSRAVLKASVLASDRVGNSLSPLTLPCQCLTISSLALGSGPAQILKEEKAV